VALLTKSLLGLCLFASAWGAEAAEPRRRFAIPPKPYAEALIDLAIQADVSLLGAAACGQGRSPGLARAATLEEALGAVLAGAPCIARVVGPGAVRVLPRPAAPSVSRPAGSLSPVSAVIVTARKRPERLDELPAGVSLISGEQLDATADRDVRDTAGQLVGVLMTNLGPGRDKLLMRGLSDGAFTGRARSTVSTYLDDTPINDNAPDPDLRLTDIARIETLRGPQGALYGSGAIAGVYRIVPNKPQLDTVSAGLGLSTAWTSGGSGSRVAEGFANAPLIPGRVALRTVAYYDVKGGYIDNVSLRLSNVDSTTRTGGRVAMRALLDDNWTLDLSLAGQRLRSQDTQYATPGAGRGTRANRVRETHNNNFAQGAMNLEGDLGWAHLQSTTALIRHDYGSLYDASAAANLFSPAGADLGLYSERARITRVIQDTVFTSKAGGAKSWLGGVYASASSSRTPAFLEVLPMTGPLMSVYNERRHDHLYELALYGEGAWQVGSGLTVSAGIRAFQTWMQVDSDIVGAPPAQSRRVQEYRHFPGLSPKLSVQYQFPSGGLVYGLYSEGFRPGGVNSTNFLTVRAIRTAFKSDRLQNFEIGAKGHFLDRRLTLRGAAFFDKWSNIQSDQYRASGLAYTANVGDADITGLEAETAYAWDFGLTLQANGLYTSPTFTRANPNFAAQLGAHLPGAPHFSGGMLVRYQRTLGEGVVLRVAGEAGYVGRARLTFNPALSARTDPVFDTDFTADLVTDRWTVGLFVSNPANASSNTFAYGNPFTFGQVRQVTPQRPRTIGLRLAAAL